MAEKINSSLYVGNALDLLPKEIFSFLVSMLFLHPIIVIAAISKCTIGWWCGGLSDISWWVRLKIFHFQCLPVPHGSLKHSCIFRYKCWKELFTQHPLLCNETSIVVWSVNNLSSLFEEALMVLLELKSWMPGISTVVRQKSLWNCLCWFCSWLAGAY